MLIETNYGNFYTELSHTLHTSAAVLLQTQERCREALLRNRMNIVPPAAAMPAAAYTAPYVSISDFHGVVDMHTGGLPQSPLAMPSRKRPIDVSGMDLDANGVFCPESPMAYPSRRRPFGCGRAESEESLASLFASCENLFASAPAAAAMACPQSPVSFPSRRRPDKSVPEAASDENLAARV